MLKAWLRLLRIVNLPTVPGDVFVGAAAVGAGVLGPVFIAAAASVGLYLFGLVDNDLVGYGRDVGRPLGEGAISLRAARSARAILLALGLSAAWVLPCGWCWLAVATVGAILVYNRTKNAVAMGLCRGLNLLLGAAALAGASDFGVWVWGLFGLWTLYIAGVTRYSEGEEANPAKRRRVGVLIGALIYLQLTALLILGSNALILAGAAMLLTLRLLKRLFPEVSAS